MSKRRFFIVLPLITVGFLAAPAKGDRVVKRVTTGYNGCLKFLALRKAKQARLARKLGQSPGNAREMCLLLKRIGLKRAIRLEREYQRAQRNDEPSRPRPTQDDPYGGSSSGFAGRGICSGGICHGDNGTTVCSGGVCD